MGGARGGQDTECRDSSCGESVRNDVKDKSNKSKEKIPGHQMHNVESLVNVSGSPILGKASDKNKSTSKHFYSIL